MSAALKWILVGLALGLGAVPIILLRCEVGVDAFCGERAGSTVYSAPVPTSPGPTTPADAPRDAIAERSPLPPSPLPRERFDLLPTELRYPVAEWNIVNFRAGWIDAVAGGGREARPSHEPLRAGPGDILTITGWAGHPRLGVRLPHVLIGRCGQVVAVVPVADRRPDVAAAVHPNLALSGWVAKVPADPLPHCEDDALRAWAVAPFGINVFPLNGEVVIIADTARGGEDMPGRYMLNAFVLRPSDNPVPVLRTITVNASRLRLRRCGGPECDVLGVVERGTHRGYVIDRQDDWVLMQFDNAAGWLSTSHLSID